MGYRRFEDRNGQVWEIRDHSGDQWQFEPVSGNPEGARTARAPGYEADPFELSVEELRHMIESAPPTRSRQRPSPFSD